MFDLGLLLDTVELLLLELLVEIAVDPDIELHRLVEEELELPVEQESAQPWMSRQHSNQIDHTTTLLDHSIDPLRPKAVQQPLRRLQ